MSRAGARQGKQGRVARAVIRARGAMSKRPGGGPCSRAAASEQCKGMTDWRGDATSRSQGHAQG
eukprot:7934444-Lingulodinium_polyedra.AAC.1